MLNPKPSRKTLVVVQGHAQCRVHVPRLPSAQGSPGHPLLLRLLVKR